MGSNPSQPAIGFGDNDSKRVNVSIDTFKRTLLLKNLTDKTIKTYLSAYRLFSKFIGKRIVTQELIEDYLIQSKNRRNNLAMFKLLYPDFVKNLKFPKPQYHLKILPSEDQIQVFYQTLPDKYKPIFILLRESGLRISELLGAQLDPVNQMIIPKQHTGITKHSYISFYRTPVKEIPKINQDSLNHAFLKTSKRTNIRIYPHLLRSVFARDCAKRGIPDRYIDAFCGRIPASVLSRSYTDFSPEVLKQIYDKMKD